MQMILRFLLKSFMTNIHKSSGRLNQWIFRGATEAFPALLWYEIEVNLLRRWWTKWDHHNIWKSSSAATTASTLWGSRRRYENETDSTSISATKFTQYRFINNYSYKYNLEMLRLRWRGCRARSTIGPRIGANDAGRRGQIFVFRLTASTGRENNNHGHAPLLRFIHPGRWRTKQQQFLHFIWVTSGRRESMRGCWSCKLH